MFIAAAKFPHSEILPDCFRSEVIVVMVAQKLSLADGLAPAPLTLSQNQGVRNAVGDLAPNLDASLEQRCIADDIASNQPRGLSGFGGGIYRLPQFAIDFADLKHAIAVGIGRATIVAE